VRKTNTATSVAVTWKDHNVIKQSCINATNVTPIEAELMAIRLGLSYSLSDNDNRNIIVITDSLTAARKIVESHVSPFQAVVAPLAVQIKEFLCKDSRNSIQFWHCPNKAEWPRHQLVDKIAKESHTQPSFPCKNSFLFSRKKECDDLIQEWQTSFVNTENKGRLFLEFEDSNLQVIKPTYTNGGSWLPSIGFYNSLCARFTRMTTGHAPIGEYKQRFFPNEPTNCPCGLAEVQTREHIVLQCSLYEPSTRPINRCLNNSVHFLHDNPTAFSFDNG